MIDTPASEENRTDDRSIGFGWKASLALWALFIGPVVDLPQPTGSVIAPVGHKVLKPNTEKKGKVILGCPPLRRE